MKFFGLSLLVAVLLGVANPSAESVKAVMAVPREKEAAPVARTFDEYKEYFGNLVFEKDAETALAEIEVELDKSPVVFEYCHALVHEIGHAAYKRYGFEEALLFEADICGSGYLHGMVEAYLADQTDVLAALKTVCDPDDGVCMHGVGHGLMMYANNDIPAALAYCDEFEAHATQIHCSEGVFMENFGLDWNLHAHPYLQVEDPMYPCDEQDAKYKNTCYFYAPRLYNRVYPNAYEQALDWCMTAETGYEQDCVRGQGSTMMKYGMDDIAGLEAICGGASGEYAALCIRGMTSYYIVNYASAEKGKELCAILKEDNQAACMEEVEAKSAFYVD